MPITAAVCLISFLCAGIVGEAKDSQDSPIACNLKAINAAERPHYNALMKRLRSAVRARDSREDGYTYQLDGAAISLPEVAEWMRLERLCCPFLKLQLSAAGNRAGYLLTLTGPKGTKALLEMEFPSPNH